MVKYLKKVSDKEFEARIASEVKKFRDKLSNELLKSGPVLKLKPNCILNDDKIMMKCIKCDIFKERTTEFFCAKTNDFEKYKAGFECLRGECRVCFSKNLANFRKTRTGFIMNLVGTYLRCGLTVQWFEDKLTEQADKCYITNMPLKMEISGENCVGIHCIDNSQKHSEKNCMLALQELNVAQWDAIPCLIKAWEDLFLRLIDSFIFKDKIKEVSTLWNENLKPKDIGIIKPTGFLENGKYSKKQYREQVNIYSRAKFQCHFKTILKHNIIHTLNHDLERSMFEIATDKKLEFIKIVYKNSLKKLKAQNYKCAYSGIDLDVENTYRRFSMERIIGKKRSHFGKDGNLNNIVFVCRLLNGPKQMSREKVLTYFLSQIRIPVPPEARLKAELELNLIQNPITKQKQEDPNLQKAEELDYIPQKNLKQKELDSMSPIKKQKVEKLSMFEYFSKKKENNLN